MPSAQDPPDVRNESHSGPQQEGSMNPVQFFQDFFWERLHATLLYAETQQLRTESALYSVYGLVYTMFCFFTTITSDFKRISLSCFPQRELRNKRQEDHNKDAERDSWRIPDFCAFITQGLKLGKMDRSRRFGGSLAFIVEIKRGDITNSRLQWRTEGSEEMSSYKTILPRFITHVPQIIEQARYAFEGMPGPGDAKGKVRAFLIVDVWFSYFEFSSSPESLEGEKGRLSKKEYEEEVLKKLKQYCLFTPRRIFSKDWSAFTPDFLRALSQAITGHKGFEMSSPEVFRVPEDPVESASAKLAELKFLDDLKRKGEAKAWNDEKVKEAVDDKEQELRIPENAAKGKGKGKGKGKDEMAYPSNAPRGDLSHLLTSPAKTRSSAAASDRRLRYTQDEDENL